MRVNPDVTDLDRTFVVLATRQFVVSQATVRSITNLGPST